MTVVVEVGTPFGLVVNCNYLCFSSSCSSSLFHSFPLWIFFHFFCKQKTLIKPDWIAVSKHSTQLGGYAKLNEEQLRMIDDVPSSAVELQAKDKASILILI